jgi:hypothetical protein
MGPVYPVEVASHAKPEDWRIKAEGEVRRGPHAVNGVGRSGIC